MVAKIQSGKSLAGILNYNERKVDQGKGILLGAFGYLKDGVELTYQDKLSRLTDLAERNHRTRTNALHVSLNFDPQELLPEEKLMAIAGSYMAAIGFGDQPFLIYQHFDTGHPHLHIVSTNIRPSGERVSLHNIGRRKSEPARKAIERQFDLVQAEGRELKAANGLVLQPLRYGKDETRATIARIVTHVFHHYRFTSLNEFNSVLEQFNVAADRGNRHSVMYKHGGLRYWALNEDGIRIGIPIKASSIYRKPILSSIEQRSKLNALLRKPAMEDMRKKVDQALLAGRDERTFLLGLKRSGVNGVLHRNVQGGLYGITFIDHQAKLVIKGSDLGKGYSSRAIWQTLVDKPLKGDAYPVAVAVPEHFKSNNRSQDLDKGAQKINLLDQLLPSEERLDNPPQELSYRKKKRKKRLHI